jgi:hypothetical protein
MVSRAPNRNLRFDSCCKVEVVKGGEGFRVTGRSSTLVILQGLLEMRSYNAKAFLSSNCKTLRPSMILPVFSSKSAPVATLTLATVTNLASNWILSFSKVAFKSQ